VDVVVTGHSKGGALADAFALWLADTQGEAPVAEAARWDPRRRATVRCLSFAGPTAGNAAFARHWDATFGDRGRRVANPLDVVTHAWMPDELGAIPDLYRDHVVSLPALRPLAKTIAAVVAPLGYRHVGVRYPDFVAAVDDTRPDFFAQLVHQHLDAYLAAMGLGDLLDTWTFFDPLG
jgi:Lipase (class 3)